MSALPDTKPAAGGADRLEWIPVLRVTRTLASLPSQLYAIPSYSFLDFFTSETRLIGVPSFDAIICCTCCSRLSRGSSVHLLHDSDGTRYPQDDHETDRDEHQQHPQE